MTASVVIFKVDALTYVILSKAEKRALWEISWYHRVYNAIEEVLHKPRLL
jgi:hypothetical protein